MTKNLRWLWYSLAIIVLIGLAVVYYFYFYKKVTPSAQSSPSPETTLSTKSSPLTTITDEGVTWIEPQILGDLNIIMIGQDTGIAGVKYYKVADFNDGGKIILASLEFEGPGFPILYRFKETPDGKYSYLMRQSGEKEYGVVSKLLQANVTIDNETIYQSLAVPDFLTINDTKLKSSTNVGLFSDLQNPELNSTPKEVGQTPYGKIYRRFLKSSNDTAGMIFALKLADSTYRDYTLKVSFLTDDEVAQITWTDGAKNTAKYTSESYVGCAMTTSDNVITKVDNTSTRLTEAGKTNSGDKIYTVSKDDSIISLAYENYKTGREQVMTLDEFAAKKPVFVWKDGLGDYIIFTGRDFKGLAECAKPVIYLYPEKDMKVSVKVGANITKSEPLYNNGWEVIASPSGRLNVAGKIYDYLFWDGTGQEYPIINTGTVVAQKDLESTLYTQLTKLGLNEKEKTDFMEFWLPKMPNTPYIRLTWLGTQQMNKLAPLTITPAPDSMIRIFLDFEGLENFVNIAPQKLSARARIGFTVIEWGGLLRK
ncbi:MAG: hypothetical protein HW405_921 [Candidatus Berkelbacteria bacterium]|nr:hypothetical protein [Candidatus Berkelbacteria bacterium]